MSEGITKHAHEKDKSLKETPEAQLSDFDDVEKHDEKRRTRGKRDPTLRCLRGADHPLFRSRSQIDPVEW